MKLNPVYMIILFLLISCPAKDEDTATSATYNYEKESEPVTYVDVLEATKSNLIPVITSSGIVKGIHETVVVSETQGIIEQVLFSIGDTTNKGTVLLKVDDTIALYNKDQVKLELETAKLEFDAAKKSYSSGSISLVELKRIENRYYAQKVRYEQALKTWKDCTVRTPISGVVAERDSRIAKGAFITPGTPIARIVDSSYYSVLISLGERQIGFLKKGQKALIMIPAATDKNIEGEVTAVAGGSDEQTGSFTAIIAWKNELGDKIKSGMSAQIRINIKPDEEHIIIPLFSIINKDDGDYVFTAVENKAVFNRITSNNSFGERIEVTDGLSEGDLIIITRISTINPGEPVKVRIVGKSGEWQ